MTKKDTLSPGWRKTGDRPTSFTQQNMLYQKLFEDIVLNNKEISLSGLNILEVGPGTGQFAKWIIENKSLEINSYTILDSSFCIHHSQSTLKKFENVDYCASDDYESLYSRDFDMLISVQCLSETPLFYAKDILEKMKYNYLFILDEENLPGAPFNDYMNSFFQNKIAESSRARITTDMYRKRTQVLFFGEKI